MHFLGENGSKDLTSFPIERAGILEYLFEFYLISGWIGKTAYAACAYYGAYRVLCGIWVVYPAAGQYSCTAYLSDPRCVHFIHQTFYYIHGLTMRR